MSAGADVVLGMVPLARELLRMGAEVVLVANSLPAINDITAPELRALLDAAGALCPTIKARRTPTPHASHGVACHICWAPRAADVASTALL